MILTEVNITEPKHVLVSDNLLYVGSNIVASWSDNSGLTCTVKLAFNGRVINS